MSNAHSGRCRLTITVTGNEGRPVYTAAINGVSQRLTGQTQLRDLIRQADRECAAAGARARKLGSVTWTAPCSAASTERALKSH